MTSRRITKALKAHVITDRRTMPRRVAVITAESMAELTKSLNAYLEMHPATGTIYNAGFDPKENRYYALVDDVFNKPAVSETFRCPLNTDQLTLGQHDVYFKEYPDIKWCVDHLDGDYAYLGLYNISERARFNYINSVSYAGSTISHKCTEYLNNIIPNVARYLEDVTVEGVTNKVFIPTFYQFSGDYAEGDASGPVFDYPSASASNRRACYAALSINTMWLSTTVSYTESLWIVHGDGIFGTTGNPSETRGFRPEVKVRFKKSS